MASLNKVMLIGNAGKDAELRYTANGIAQAKFSLAVGFRRRAVSGEWEDATEWFNIILFRDTAEKVSQYITKGKSVYVEGRLQTRSWDDESGQKRYMTEVIANTVQLLGSRDSGGGSGGSGEWDESAGGGRPRNSANAGARGGAYTPAQGGDDIDADDLPVE